MFRITHFVILALVGYRFDQCRVVFNLVTLSFCCTTSFKLFFSTKFSNGKTLGGMSVIGLGRYCFKVSVAANCMKLGGVFTEFGLSKLVNKHRLGLILGSRVTLHWLLLGVLSL